MIHEQVGRTSPIKQPFQYHCMIVAFTNWERTKKHINPWRSKGDAKKGTGRKTSDDVMTSRSPSPPTRFCQRPPPPRPLPLMSSEVQKRGKLVREIMGPKVKTNGRARDALSWHFLSRPLPSVPFWPSPNSEKRQKQNLHGIVPKMFGGFCLCAFLPQREWPEKTHKQMFVTLPVLVNPAHLLIFMCFFLTNGF